MNKYQDWNNNPELWKDIENILQKLSKNFDIEWNQDSFKDFYLSKICYTNNNQFIIEGNYSLVKKVKYLEDRNSDNRKIWAKEKQNIENSFKTFFPKFSLPEQSYRAVINPLLNQTSDSNLKMENEKSQILNERQIEDILGLQLDKYSSLISIQLEVSQKDTTLEKPAKIGTNEIEDGNIATIFIKTKVLLRFPLEYCLYVINSTVLSEILFYNYVNLQLTAYQGYNDYPNKQINIISSTVYPFDSLKESTIPFKVSYPDGQIYYIQKSNLSYDNYVLETKKLYNPTKRELIGEIFDLDSLKNKVLNFDKITKQYIYTDSFGTIQRLDLSGSEDLSQDRIETILKFSCDSDIINRFFKVVSAIYEKIDMSNKYNAEQIFEEERVFYRKFSEITKENCPTVFQILNDCYNQWDSINFDLLLKSKFKVYLNILLFENYNKNSQLDINSDLKAYGLLEKFSSVPVALADLWKKNSKNLLIDFEKPFRDSFFFTKISIMQLNNKIRKAAIITFEDLDVYNRLQNFSNQAFNGIVINRDTIRHLYEEFGNNLLTYLKNAPLNTVYIIHPNVFFESSILGDTDLYQANKLSFRSLISELLMSIGLDFVVYYKENQIKTSDFLTSNLRNIFSSTKYRAIYGNIDFNDILVLDPNSSVDTLYNSDSIKKDFKISEEEAKAYGEICLKTNSYLSFLPKLNINTYIVEATKSQLDYYKELVNLSFEKMTNDEDFKEAVLASDLNNLNEIESLVSNFMTLPDIFLNAPDNDLFVFKEKFEQENNPNIKSNKLEILYNLLSSHLFSGVVEGVRKSAKSTSILVICENRVVRDHLYKELSPRFYGNICFKFENGSQIELDTFRNKRIGFITVDLLKSYISLPNVSNYIMVQNSWVGNEISDLLNYIFSNSFRHPMEEDLELNYILFDKSLELNKYALEISTFVNSEYNNTLNSKLNFESSIFDNLSDKVLDFTKLEILEWENIRFWSLQDKVSYIINKKRSYSENVLANWKQNIFNTYGINFSKEDLLKMTFSAIEISDIYSEEKYYVPFINGMYLNFFDLMEAEIDERFSDINGNAYFYSNGKLQLNIPVYTEYGSGYITGDSGDKYVIDVLKAKEFLVPKDLVYKIKLSNAEPFVEYISAISSTGDSKIDLDLLQEVKIKKKDSDIELDKKDNSVALSIDRINGLFSIYTSAEDSDNIRLENFNFNHFSNIFIVEVQQDNFEDLIKFFKFNQADADYLAVLTEAFNQWKQGSEFLLAPSYDYFSCEQIKTELPRIYAMIWNKKYYILFNGNFYSKLGHKLSRKFSVSLLKNLYIQSFKDLKDCKYELLKISKTLNIINLQNLLEFFAQEFEKLDYLKISEVQEDRADRNNKDTLLQILKTKEAKLKKHIKEIRRDKYGQ